jgi:hypothetical protein
VRRAAGAGDLPFSALLAWDVDTLEHAAAAVRSLRSAVAGAADDLGLVSSRLDEHWAGLAATAATSSLGRVTAGAARLDASLGFVHRILCAAEDALRPARDLARDARTYAEQHGLLLNEDGRCSPGSWPLVDPHSPTAHHAQYEYERRRAAAEQAQAMAMQALRAAREADLAAARALARAWESSADGSTWDTADRASLSDITTRPCPPEGATPAEVAAWWASLSEAEQRELITSRSDLIGNLDGVPVAARARANERRLTDALRDARADLEAERHAYETAATAASSRADYEALRPLVASRDAAQRQVEMLEAIASALDAGPGRSLMLLDTQMPGHAAIAVGNVDTAAHVAVLVPGMDSYVTNYIGGLADNAERVQVMGDGALVGSGEVAAIAWIGYTAPTIPNVGVDDQAVGAAPKLASAIDGIEASRAAGHRPVHITTVGHSYGSLVSGLTAATYTAMDDLVVFGSPGLGAGDVSGLDLPASHVFVGEAKGDPVADFERFGGVDPASPSFGAVPIQTDGGAHPLGGETTAVSGHSRYLEPGSESLLNIVAVVIGRPDAVTVGHTYDAGDHLWMQ